MNNKHKSKELLSSIEFEERRIFFKLLILIGIPFLGSFLIKNLLMGRYVVVFLLMPMFLLLLFILPVFKKNIAQSEQDKWYQTFFYIFFISLAATLIYLIGIKGEFSKIPWFYIFLLMSFLALGYRVGLLLTAVLFFLILLISSVFPVEIPVPISELKLRFSMSVVIITIISYFMERWRFQYKQELIENQLKLEESEKKFRNLIEFSNDWVWEVDKEFKYTYASPLVEKILGYTPEEIVGKTPFDFMPPEEIKRLSPIVEDLAIKGLSIVALENVNFHKNGHRVILETSGVPVFNNTGELVYYRGIDRDVTERKKNEKEREQLISKLESAIENIKTLEGLIPICSSCKKIRNDTGYWDILESYIQKHSNAKFSHSLCPDCSDNFYGNEDWYLEMKERKKKAKNKF